MPIRVLFETLTFRALAAAVQALMVADAFALPLLDSAWPSAQPAL
jgi:hypothetical protein